MIKIETEKYKLLKKIKDPKFNIDNLEHYNLSLQLGVRDFQVFVYNTQEKRALLLEDYIFNQEVSSDTILEIIKDIIDNHHLLAAGFWKSVSVVIKNRKFALVPEQLYEKEQAHTFLLLNHAISSKDTIYSIHHKNTFVNIFAAERRFSNFFNSNYPNIRIKFIHQSSPIINGTLRLGENTFLMYIDRFNMHLSVVKNGKLLYYNQFQIKKMEDFTRFTKLVASELQVKLEKTKIVAYGFIGKNSPQYNYLKQHFPQLTLGEKPRQIKFGYVFDEIPDHQFFDVFSLY